jgi:excisionase family DNA binding protein
MTDSRRSRLPRLMTIADAAEALAVSNRTVRRLIDEGALRAIKVRRQVRIHPADLDDYLTRCRDGHSWLVLAQKC